MLEPDEPYPESRTKHVPPLFFNGTLPRPPEMKEEDKPHLYYHKGWKTCTIEGTNLESLSELRAVVACPSGK